MTRRVVMTIPACLPPKVEDALRDILRHVGGEDVATTTGRPPRARAPAQRPCDARVGRWPMTPPLTLEERVYRTVNRLAVVERLLELEGLEAADNREHEDAVRAGLHALIVASYEDLKPIEHAPAAITSWEPDRDETGGERTTQPAAG